MFLVLFAAFLVGGAGGIGGAGTVFFHLPRPLPAC